MNDPGAGAGADAPHGSECARTCKVKEVHHLRMNWKKSYQPKNLQWSTPMANIPRKLKWKTTSKLKLLMATEKF